MNVHWEQIIAMIMQLVLIHLVPTPVNVTKVSPEMEKIVKVGENSFADDIQYCLNSEGVCVGFFRTNMGSLFFLVYLSN
jgi:hypothetical protein